jgi:twinkle protein
MTYKNNSKIILLHAPCPSLTCNSSDAYCEYEDGHGHCYSCDYHKHPDRGGELEESYTYEYLPWRGVNKQTMEFYDVKTKVDGEGKPLSVFYAYPNASIKIRKLDEKKFRTEGEINKGGLFGRNKFSAGAAKYVTITEGELDALSLHQALGGGPVVSVQSATTAARDVALERSWVNSYERIYLAFDNDEPGREAVASVAKLFDYNKIYVVKFSKRKDANEYLEHGEGDELKRIWWNAKRYLPETIISSFHDFEKILKEPKKEGVSYPFPTLNHLTYGIRTGESVLITAQEGVGKTEIMHTIEHHLLKETKDAIAVIHLEEPKQRYLQALAGIELRQPVHLPSSTASVDEVVAALTSVVSDDDRLHLYSHFGSNDPEVLLDTIRFVVTARSCKYVFLDHITMAVSGLSGEDERRALDYLSTRLEMMVKELDFSLIFVSHVNDLGQTRGSRNIAKIADIRIDAKRDVLATDDRLRRTTELSVSKNRFASQTGAAGKLLFDPVTYTLEEDLGLEHANDNSAEGLENSKAA